MGWYLTGSRQDDGMASDETSFRLRELNECLMALAMEPEEQIRWIGCAHPDELGLAFDDGFRLIRSLELDGVVLPSEARTILDEISRRLDMMSGAQNAELWTEAAIRTDPQWVELRLLARRVLSDPGWPGVPEDRR